MGAWKSRFKMAFDQVGSCSACWPASRLLLPVANRAKPHRFALAERNFPAQFSKIISWGISSRTRSGS